MKLVVCPCGGQWGEEFIEEGVIGVCPDCFEDTEIVEVLGKLH